MSKDSLKQAYATLESISELLDNLHNAKTNDEREYVIDRINEHPLEVSVRWGWVHPGENTDVKPEEFLILICTGGPAVRITGTLDEYAQPDKVYLEHQDWYEPWTQVDLTDEQRNILLRYASFFYYG
ncbi:MAG TPA: hypothetical protein P5046_05195 [Sphaerochaeta sp.]|nr:hypothetical protein [Sphaerochaeta sp.]